MAKALALCARAKRKHERTAYVRRLKVRTGRPSLGGVRKLPRYLGAALLRPKKGKQICLVFLVLPAKACERIHLLTCSKDRSIAVASSNT